MSHSFVDADNVSRRTSISRRSSMTSKRGSLIQKNTAPVGANELRPSDLLLDRFLAWKSLVKQLVQYFEGLADIENNRAIALVRLGGVIQVPFREGHQFLGEGGLQDVYYKLRDGARSAGDTHASLGKTIDSSIVQHLIKLKSEIKAHITNIKQDTGKLATAVAKERELSVKAISDLSKAITVAKNTPMSVHSKEDPYVANTLVNRQLQKQVNEENSLQKSIIIMQSNSAHFEQGIVRSIQSAWATFDEWQARANSTAQDTWRHMGVSLASIRPEAEWVSFAARSDHLLSPETPLRSVEHIEYPGKADPSVVPIHDGMLERKRRYTKTYQESYYVLTPAGYLHEYKTSDPTTASTPTFSLFLLACTLGPAAGPNSKSHKFHIELKSNDKAGFKAITNRDQGYTFRARSRPEMLSWWNDLRMLCARSLIASDEMDRSGPVYAAVREAGYNDEDYASSMSEGEDGSSIDEEVDEHDHEEHPQYISSHHEHHHQNVGNDAASTSHTEAVPAYSTPAAESRIQVDSAGYATEKKGIAKETAGKDAPNSENDVPASVTPPQGDAQDAAAGAGLLGRFKEMVVGSPRTAVPES